MARPRTAVEQDLMDHLNGADQPDQADVDRRERGRHRLVCSSEGCPRAAVQALALRDQPGHVHDCAEHAHDLREFCDVTSSAPLMHGRCPWPCTAEPIHTSEPQALA